jgi:predicted permease
MSTFQRWWSRLVGSFAGTRSDEEFAEELETHLQFEIDELLKKGKSPAEARREALIRTGGIELAKEAYREQRGIPMIDQLRRDVAYALRTLRNAPGFTAVVVATLALGIGASTAVFTAVDAVLLHPLAYPEADRLVGLWLNGRGSSVGPGEYAAVRQRTRTMEEVAAWSGWTFAVTGDGDAEEIEGARVTTNLPGMLGALPLYGRTFREEESLPWPGPTYAGGSAALLSYGFWQRRYGGDPEVVGRTITIDGMGVPIVGVLPESFDFPSPRVELWLPIAVDPSEAPAGGGAYTLLGRLREGVSPEDALLDARGIATALRNEHADRFPTNYGEAAEVLALRDALVGSTKQTLLLLFGAVGCVLLVACANLANLFLARATGRRREMSIRAALGAGRSRLVRQSVTEHLTLACLGAVLGLALAQWGARLFASTLPPDLIGSTEITVSGRALVFAVVLTGLAGLLSGIMPALRTAQGEPNVPLREAGRGASSGPDHRRLLASLVVAELALAIVLVLGAGLTLQSFWSLSRQDPGFRPEGVLTFRASPPESFYSQAPQRERLTASVLERAAGLPGVVSAGATHILPLGGGNWSNRLEVEARPLPPGQNGPAVSWQVVTPEYFQTLGVPLLAGRGFTPADRADDQPVAVISETVRRQVFPSEDPIGRRVRTGFDGEQWVTIVGVVGDTKDRDLASGTWLQIYRPHSQVPIGSMSYMIRTEGDPLAVAETMREVVADLDENVPVSEIQRLEDVVARSIALPRLLMLLLVGFGVVSILLAALGVYGVTSYAVGQRTREFGIRLALGARPVDMLYQVVAAGVKLALLGLLLGISTFVVLVPFLESRLYEIEPFDAPTFTVVVVLLWVVALLGSYLPARRAAGVDPLTSLAQG